MWELSVGAYRGITRRTTMLRDGWIVNGHGRSRHLVLGGHERVGLNDFGLLLLLLLLWILHGIRYFSKRSGSLPHPHLEMGCREGVVQVRLRETMIRHVHVGLGERARDRIGHTHPPVVVRLCRRNARVVVMHGSGRMILVVSLRGGVTAIAIVRPCGRRRRARGVRITRGSLCEIMGPLITRGIFARRFRPPHRAVDGGGNNLPALFVCWAANFAEWWGVDRATDRVSGRSPIAFTGKIFGSAKVLRFIATHDRWTVLCCFRGRGHW